MLTKQQSVETLSRALAALRADRLDEADALARSLLQAAQSRRASVGRKRRVPTRVLCRGEARAASSLALRPGHAPTLMLAGRAARAGENSGRAKDWFRLASQTSEGSAEAWFQLGVAEIECDDPNVSSTLATLVARYPGDAAGWREIGAPLCAPSISTPRRAPSRAQWRRRTIPRMRSISALRCSRADERKTRSSCFAACAKARRTVWSHCCRLPAPCARSARRLRRARVSCDWSRRSPTMPQSFIRWGWSATTCAIGRARSPPMAAAFELPPDMPEAHVNLGLALQQTGELEPALQCYRRAMRLRPDTFGRIAQALPSTAKGMLWLDLRRLRRSLGGLTLPRLTRNFLR